MTKKRIKIPSIFEGLDEVTPNTLLKETKAQILSNYQVDSLLSTRRAYDKETYALGTVLESDYDSIISIHGPFYSDNELDTATYHTNDKGFYVLVFGLIGSTYTLRLYLYNTLEGWTHENETSESLIDFGGDVVFTEDSNIETSQLGDRIIIVDGVNKPLYVMLHPDGNIYSGIAGIPAPKVKPTIDVDEEYEVSNFTTNQDNYVSTPGIVQCCYTVVTKEGEESNPSPISLSKNMAFYRKNDEGEDTQWINKIKVSGLSVSEGLSGDILNSIKYFNIYARVIPYSEGYTPKAFELAKRLDIVEGYKKLFEEVAMECDFDNMGTIDLGNPEGDSSWIGGVVKITNSSLNDGYYYITAATSRTLRVIPEPVNEVGGECDLTVYGTPGNNYSLSSSFEVGTSVGYENDTPSPAKTVAGVGGVTFYGAPIQENIRTPYEYRNVQPIIISNPNNINYAPALVEIELSEDDITGFDVTDFVSTGDNLYTSKLVHIRLFDEDLTTPLPFYVRYVSETNGIIRGFAQIPQLVPGATHLVYLCFTPSAHQANYKGFRGIVPNDYEHGLFFQEGVSDWDDQIFFKPITTTSLKDVLAIPGLPGQGNNIINNADINSADTSYLSNEPNYDQIFYPYFLSNSYLMDGLIEYDEDNKYSEFKNINTVRTAEKENMVFLFEAMFKPDITTATFHDIFRITEDSSDYLKLFWDNTSKELTFVQIQDSSTKDSMTIELPDGLSGTMYIAFCLDANNNTASLFVYEKGATYDKIHIQTKSTFSFSEDEAHIYEYISIGSSTLSTSDKLSYSNVLFRYDQSINLDSEEHLNYLMHRMNYLTGFMSPVGVNYTDYYELTNDDFSDGTTGWTIMSGVLSESGDIATMQQLGGNPCRIRNSTNIVDDGVEEIVVLVRYKTNVAPGDALFAIFPDTGTFELPESTDYSIHGFRLKLTGTDYFDLALVDATSIAYIDYVKIYKVSHNNNISFKDTVILDQEIKERTIKWTKPNLMASPDLYFKNVNEPIEKIIPAPSFLRMEYQNTLLVFTKNSIYRFVLSGDPDQWAAGTSQLIDEKRGYGLYAKKSLVRLDDVIYWLSEDGVMQWDSNGMRNISKDYVNIPLNEDAIGWYNPANDEYMIYSPEE